MSTMLFMDKDPGMLSFTDTIGDLPAARTTVEQFENGLKPRAERVRQRIGSNMSFVPHGGPDRKDVEKESL